MIELAAHTLTIAHTSSVDRRRRRHRPTLQSPPPMASQPQQPQPMPLAPAAPLQQPQQPKMMAAGMLLVRAVCGGDVAEVRGVLVGGIDRLLAAAAVVVGVLCWIDRSTRPSTDRLAHQPTPHNLDITPLSTNLSMRFISLVR
jgi:hypothetical protein